MLVLRTTADFIWHPQSVRHRCVTAELQARLKQWMFQTCLHRLFAKCMTCSSSIKLIERCHLKFADENRKDNLFVLTVVVCKLEAPSSWSA